MNKFIKLTEFIFESLQVDKLGIEIKYDYINKSYKIINKKNKNIIIYKIIFDECYIYNFENDEEFETDCLNHDILDFICR